MREREREKANSEPIVNKFTRERRFKRVITDDKIQHERTCIVLINKNERRKCEFFSNSSNKDKHPHESKSGSMPKIQKK